MAPNICVAFDRGHSQACGLMTCYMGLSRAYGHVHQNLPVSHLKSSPNLSIYTFM